MPNLGGTQHMQVHRRVAVLAAAVASLVVAAPASAGIWTPVSSGTTDTITAIEYQGPDRLFYTTAGGQILKNGAAQSTIPGTSFNDIAFNPSGTVGLAAGSNGKLYRYNGSAWTLVSLANSTYTDSSPCGSAGATVLTKNAAPAGNLNAVAWASDAVAYVVASDPGVVLKTTNGGSTWTDVSRQADSTCFVDAGGSSVLSDVKTIPGSDVVWVLDDNFGGRYISSNGLLSSAARQNSTAVNCFNKRPQLALDPANSNRSFVTDRCTGGLSLGFSEDNGINYEISQKYVAGQESSLNGLNDVAVAGGAALAVGNSGAILIDSDGRNAYFQRGDGADATNDWFAVDKADATTAAVGGRGGRLLTTTQATTIPDIVAPSGTISGPTTATAGVPTTYTANVADNAGGSGIDGAGFAWSSAGLPGATGNPVGLTFPSAGFYTVKVAFKDLAGTPGEATLGVTVKAAAAAPQAKKTVAVAGAKITFAVPGTCVAPGKTFTVTLSWKKVKKKGNKFIKVFRSDFYIGSKRVTIDKTAPFRQTLTVTASAKPGSQITVRARAFMKVRRGKSPTKSIRSTIKVCG
jgi:hypothetical protein